MLCFAFCFYIFFSFAPTSFCIQCKNHILALFPFPSFLHIPTAQSDYIECTFPDFNLIYSFECLSSSFYFSLSSSLFFPLFCIECNLRIVPDILSDLFFSHIGTQFLTGLHSMQLLFPICFLKWPLFRFH